jgi:putative Mg2+ transporter-C (MgtC) family protein
MDLYFSNIYIDVLVKLVLAAMLGSVVGLEREVHRRAAGLRTHLLVSLGAGVFMILSPLIANQSINAARSGDPARIAAQIVTGIGFLGAGAIIKHGSSIKGLTTAASLWMAAAIGMSCGSGYFYIAVIATSITLFALVVLPKFSRNVNKNLDRRNLTFTIDTTDNINSKIFDFFKNKKISVVEFYSNIDAQKKETEYVVYIIGDQENFDLPYEIRKYLKSLNINLKKISEHDGIHFS